MWKRTLTVAALLAASCFAAEQPDKEPRIFVAAVDHVVDGDSLVVVVDKAKISIRIEGLDAPEPKQAFGQQAKEALALALPQGAEVVIEDMGTDKYGRILAIVHNRKFSPESISEYLIKQGYAWHFAKYNKNKSLAKSQQLAQSQRRGLWAVENNPVAPWDYRIRHDRGEVMDQKKVHKATPEFERQRQRVELTRWLNLENRERHSVSCPRAAHCHGRPCGKVEGLACKRCGG